MREVVGSTQPDMQRRCLDIKKYFFDVIAAKMNSEEGVLADVNISQIPHIFDGLKLPMGHIQMAKLPHGPRIEIPMGSEDLERQFFSQNTIKMFEMPPLE